MLLNAQKDALRPTVSLILLYQIMATLPWFWGPFIFINYAAITSKMAQWVNGFKSVFPRLSQSILISCCSLKAEN